MLLVPHFTIVHQKEAAVVESWGKFEKVLHAGVHLILPWQSVAGKLSLKVQEMPVNVETKTKDDVFARVLIAVQRHRQQSARGAGGPGQDRTVVRAVAYDLVR
jgi:regulator of protease activity HflC (stomatin/prohibitin superfamily)